MTAIEASELAGRAIDRLAPRLSRLAEPAPPAGAGPGAPLRRLHQLVTDRFGALGEQEALAELVREPWNNSLAKRLLAAAVTADPGYAAELAAATDAVPATEAVPRERAARRPGDPAAGVPARSDGGRSGDPAAGVPAGSDGGRGPRRLGRRGLMISLAGIVVLAVLGWLVGRAVVDDLTGAGGLTSESTCADFRRAPAEERVAAIRQIGLAKGISGADSPLVMSAVDQLCDAQPSARLGDLLGRLDD